MKWSKILGVCLAMGFAASVASPLHAAEYGMATKLDSAELSASGTKSVLPIKAPAIQRKSRGKTLPRLTPSMETRRRFGVRVGLTASRGSRTI